MNRDNMINGVKNRTNKEWGITEERYHRTAPDAQKPKRRFRKRDSLPVIFVLALLALIAIGGWRMSAKADPVVLSIGFDPAEYHAVDRPLYYGDVVPTPKLVDLSDQENPTYSALPDGAEIAYSGTLLNETPYPSSAIAPAQAGNYVVTVTITELSDDPEPEEIVKSGSASFTILPIDISGGTVVLGNTETYNGTLLTQSVSSVTVADSLVDPIEYTVTNNTQTNAGNYNLTINATGNNYTGSITKAFSIAKSKLKIVGVSANNKEYDGTTSVELDKTGMLVYGVASADEKDTDHGRVIDSTKLNLGVSGEFVDKTANAGKPVNITYTITSGSSKDNYEINTDDSLTEVTATISPKSISVSGIKAEDKPFDNDTTATLKYDDVAFAGKVDGDTLSVTASGVFEDKEVGTNKNVTISGITLGGADAGNYSLATTTATTKASIYSAAVVPTIAISGTYTYNGKAQTPSFTVKVGDKTLKSGTDYAIKSLTDNINAGTATLTIEDKDGSLYHFDDISKQFEIKRASLNANNIVLVGNSMTYNGNTQTQEVKIVFNDTELNLSGFSVENNTGKDAGTYTLKVTNNTNPNVVVSSSASKSFTIAKKDVVVKGFKAKEKPYDGKADAELVLTDVTIEGIVAGSGDTLSVKSAKGTFANRNVGDANIVSITDIVLEGTSAKNYQAGSGSDTQTTAKISRKSITPVITVTGTYKYTGSPITPTYTVSDGDGNALESTDYNVSVSNNTNAGNGLITISQKDGGNYSFSQKEKSFEIGQATKLASSPKTSLTLDATSTAETVGEIPVSQLGVSASDWKWDSSSEDTALTAGKTIKAKVVYTGSDAENYTEKARTITVQITVPAGSKTGSSTKTSTGTGSSSTRSSSTASSGKTSGSKTSSSTGSSSGSTSSRTSGSSSSGSSSRTGSSRTGSSSSSSTGADGTTQSSAKPPFIEGSPDLSGWDAIALRISGTATGDSVPVYMNGTVVVPASLINGMKGRNVTAVLDMGNSIKWNINGMCVADELTDDVNFGIQTNTNGIPVELIKLASPDDYTMQIHLDHDGDFGCAPILTLNLGANNAGLYANLFYYNESANALEFITADEIGEDGTASLTFAHASEYVIIVDKEILANVAVHLDKPASDSADKMDDGAAEISKIADPNSTEAYVASAPMEENYSPKSEAVARRIVAPEVRKGVTIFWILLLVTAVLVGINMYLFMNRADLKARASSKASKKALARTGNRAAAPAAAKATPAATTSQAASARKAEKDLKNLQKANSRKFKKYL